MAGDNAGGSVVAAVGSGGMGTKGVVAATVVTAVVVWRRVVASDLMDRVDRSKRSIFGFAGKSPPEKFSGAPHCYHSAAKPDFEGVTDWYQEPSVMDVPLLLDHAFDFFAVVPVPGLAEALDSQNGWIEWDVPLGGEMDEPMKNPGFDEEEELNEFMDDDQDEEVKEWLMAPVTPPRATVTVSSTYDIGGPSTATPVGHPLTTMASGVATQP
nr:hypothetical protein [Tanacetum cinerariifolium]